MASAQICSIDGCDNPSYKRGWCTMHYSRWRRAGDPLAPLKRGAPLKFFTGTVLACFAKDCLTWPFGLSAQGYGAICVDGRMRGVHNLACEKRHGPAPSPKHQAAHSCGNRPCCNPEHLRWATNKENSDDRKLHGTQPRGGGHHSAKLSDADVEQIRAMAGKYPQRVIAEKFGVVRQTISHIITGFRWAG